MNSSATSHEVGRLIIDLVNEILEETGTPKEAGNEFQAHAHTIRNRIKHTDWSSVTDDETPFTASPKSLVKWAPIIDELKQLDESIVINSVRFRWQEVRRDLRRNLDANAVLGITH